MVVFLFFIFYFYLRVYLFWFPRLALGFFERFILYQTHFPSTPILTMEKKEAYIFRKELYIYSKIWVYFNSSWTHLLASMSKRIQNVQKAYYPKNANVIMF